ncbi:amino acid permease [Alicyclobacillus sp. SO9]|uniref:amino acid permease n=1 Tax=Alicyclobacillus sp. SO9 TaxID=2665646 RepID=UPI0018E7F404|nr:amino acid permease [Alicyclobacillus sp. SO9]QQE81005.1 amino acid permease [Alicyclobacillus sp. SO9]
MSRKQSHSNTQDNVDGLRRAMSSRQIQMLAIGGVIGVGLFYGASLSVKIAGPGVIIDFIVCGIIVAIVMRALAEMTAERPISGSFSTYAGEVLGPGFGFVTAGMWWFFWVATVMSELAAIGKLIQFWFPGIPAWLPGAVALVLFTLSNLLTVKVFGELEYWFAILKVLAVLVFMVFGLLIILTGVFNHGQAVGLSNLWRHGGFLPNGFLGVVMAISLTVQAYSGVETLAVESGETRNPEKNVRKAFNTVTWRIGILYIGSIFIMLAAFPWDYLTHHSGSPYVLLFEKIGIPVAASVVNIIIILSGLSSCNTGLYGGSRMIFGATRGGRFGRTLGALNSKQIPHVAVFATGLSIAVGIVITYLAPNRVYVWITSASAFADLWVWAIILVSEIMFRKRTEFQFQGTGLRFAMPFWPLTPILGFVLIVVAFTAIVVSPLTRISVFSGVVFLGVLWIYYWAAVKKHSTAAR